jgi:hypothetical protein
MGPNRGSFWNKFIRTTLRAVFTYTVNTQILGAYFMKFFPIRTLVCHSNLSYLEYCHPHCINKCNATNEQRGVLWRMACCVFSERKNREDWNVLVVVWPSPHANRWLNYTRAGPQACSVWGVSMHMYAGEQGLGLTHTHTCSWEIALKNLLNVLKRIDRSLYIACCVAKFAVPQAVLGSKDVL